MRSICEGLAFLRREIAGQGERAFLWLVVAFASGAALFFAWAADPPLWLGPLAAGAGLVLMRVPVARPVAIALIAVAAGHSAAHFRTAAVATPLLEREIGPVPITGVVLETERRPNASRMIIAPESIPRVPAENTPRRLRVTVPPAHGLPRAGDVVSVMAIVGPAMRPAVPDGFDFQRFLYFSQIGAVGYAVGRWQQISAPAELTWQASFLATTEAWRRAIGERIRAVVPGDAGAVATALVNGEQSAIPEDLQEAYRAAGLAHLLSISGLHMTLLAGVVFFIVRRCIALVPYVALRTDAKKVAAWAGLAVTGLYLLISGMSVPAVRSFLMIAVVMGAVLLDRTALSLRTIAWAALLLLGLFPDAVFGASFQMSFIAVLALIALYENTWLRIPWRDANGQFTLLRAVIAYGLALVVTDLVAGGATAVFAAYHFNRLPTYSVIANLVAVPVSGLWVMPAALLGAAAMPFGLETIPLKIMGSGVEVLNGMARGIAKWPFAQIHFPPMATGAMIAAACGLIFICLWRGRARWLGIAPLAAGLIQPWLARPPDILVDESARVLAVSDPDGGLVLVPRRTGRFVRDVWTERYGVSARRWPLPDTTCDSGGCILMRRDQRVLLAFDARGLAEDCGQVDVIVSTIPAYDICREGTIIDRIHLLRSGTHALWITADDVRVRTAVEGAGQRVWTRGVPNSAAEDPPTDPAP